MKDITLYGAEWCQYCHALRSRLDAKNIPYTYKDVDVPEVGKEHEALAVGNIPAGKKGVPTVVVDGDVQVHPTDEWLREKGVFEEVQTMGDTNKIHDVLMVGAGPTSLAAAIYTTREDLETTLYEKGVIGGLASTTDWVDNYPGFPDGIAGLELGENLRKQAERFGAKIELGEVLNLQTKDGLVEVDTTDGLLKAKAVLIATGSDYKKLGIPGEAEYYGRGVHYCATCDGAFYRDKKLVVVGGGNSAVQEAMFLTKFASHIDLLVRGDSFRASDVLVKELEKFPQITVHMNTTTDEIVANNEGRIEKVLGTNKLTGEKIEFSTDGVFVFVGLLPNTSFLKNTGIELDEIGLIKTDQNLQTNIPGVFCAGDVRSGATMQIASAVGEGATAALQIRKYIESL